MKSISNLLRLGLWNAKFWRWRLLVISLLITLSFTLFLLYGGMNASMMQSGIASIDYVETPYYDMLVCLTEEQRLKSLEEMPSPRFGRKLISNWEAAAYLQLATNHGNIQALGILPDSKFFGVRDEDVTMFTNLGEYEVILPQSWAERNGLNCGDTLELSFRSSQEISSWSVRVVNIHPDDGIMPLLLTNYSDLLPFMAHGVGNARLICMEEHMASQDGLLYKGMFGYDANYETLGYLSEYIAQVYPGAAQFSAYLPELLGRSMLEQAYQPGNFLFVFIFLFMGIGVLTIALMTFLERRKELASLKSVGIANRQVVVMLGFEYSLTEILGLITTAVAYLLLSSKVSWFAELSSNQLQWLILQGLAITVIVLCFALVYPVLLAKVATVNQLLFARTIPLSVHKIDHLLNPTGQQVLREQEENVRLVRIPFSDGRYDCMKFKEVGDRVKTGEVVASQELSQGHFINDFLAPCDGTVIELIGPNMVIKPDNPDEPYYPYPSSLVEDELHRREVFAKAREQVRQDQKEQKG